MKAREIRKDIYWVGGIDWNLRNFHGYETPRGSTYNAYLVMDDKITLVDTVKYHLVDEMLERISSVVDPRKIDYVVSNHVEMDHSGGLPRIMQLASNAAVVASPQGERGLRNITARPGISWCAKPARRSVSVRAISRSYRRR